MAAPAYARPKVSAADLMTAANAVCGFLAMALVAARLPDGRPLDDHTVAVAGVLIIAGGLLDSIDGAVARRWGSSGLGEHLEGMSDVVTFGLAPAVLFGADAHVAAAPWPALALAAGAAYVVAAMVRLARYATLRDGAGDHALVGLPSPPAAMALTSVVVLHPPAAAGVAAVLALAALMLGSFPFPTIEGLIVPFMAGWWIFAALAALGLAPAWSLAAFTLAVITTVLLVLLAAQARRRPAGRRPSAPARRSRDAAARDPRA